MATDAEWRALVRRSGLRVMFCGYCERVCLAGKRTLCCGDAAYEERAVVDAFTGAAEETTSG